MKKISPLQWCVVLVVVLHTIFLWTNEQTLKETVGELSTDLVIGLTFWLSRRPIQ